MSALHDLAAQVTRALEATNSCDPMGLIRAKGQLATKTGFLVAMITPQDPDDPTKLDRLRAAATELGLL